MNTSDQEISLKVNGKERALLVDPTDTLLDVLREELDLKGTKDGYSLRVGGWDTVIMNGEAVPASLVLAKEAGEKDIETIEGVAEQEHPIVESFVNENHIQGGYDVPGKIMSAKALLDKNPQPTREEVVEALSGVLGREGIYPKDVEAVLKAAKELGKGDLEKIEEELERAGELESFTAVRREDQENSYLGKGIITRSGEAYPKATGQAEYSRDIDLPDMLYAKWLVSPYPRAKVKNVDTNEAEKIEGVVGVHTREDSMFKDLPMAGWLEEYPLITNEPEFEGDEAGVIVVAESEKACDRALDALEVKWEELPFVLDPEEALEPDAPIIHPEINEESNILDSANWSLVETDEGIEEKDQKLEDAEEEFEKADYVFEGRTVFRPQSHQSDDVSTGVATWKGEHLHIWEGVQDPRYREERLGTLLEMPKTKIHVHLANVGGSFGGDLLNDRSGTRHHVAAALLSKEHNRPVKIIQTRRAAFKYSNAKEIADYKVGAMEDGTINIVRLDTIVDAGGTGGGAAFWGTGYWNMPIRHFQYFTSVPKVEHNQKIVLTNHQPAWWFRCEKSGTDWITGSIFNKVADELGLDPTEVALKNTPEKGKESLEKCIEIGKEKIEWDEKWHDPREKELPNGKLHGIGFSWAWEWDSGAHGSAAVRIAEDGSVSLIGAAPDMGVAAHTTYHNVIAEALGVEPEYINYTPDSSDNTDRGYILADFGGSWTCGGNVDVIWEAAQKAKKILLDRASEELLKSPDLLEIDKGEIYAKNAPDERISIADAVGTYDIVASVSTRCMLEKDDCPFGSWACPYGFGKQREHPCYQSHFVEVEVDPETGLVEVDKIVNLNDVGRILLRSGVAGQQYGGSYMAAGRALQDELVHDPETGALLNGNLEDYKVPEITDLGEIEDVGLEVGEGPGALGVVGVGEDISTDLPIAIANAVHNAIGAVPEDHERPFTPDKILKALGKTEDWES